MNLGSYLSKSLLAVTLTMLAGSLSASATDLNLYAAKATIRGYVLKTSGSAQVLQARRFNPVQFTNLVLGQPLDTKLPAGVTLAVAADFNGVSSSDPTSTKQLVVVNTLNSQLLATVLISDPTSVFNAQNTYRTFKRLAFGVGLVQTTGNTQFGTTAGRVQMIGLMLRKMTSTGVEPILTTTMVGSMHVILEGAPDTFYVTNGVVTATGHPIGVLSN